MMALAWLLALLPAEKFELVRGVSGSRSDYLEIRAGGLVLREGSAGSAFGTVRVGKGKRELTYFVVLKHDLGKAKVSNFEEEALADRVGGGKSKQTITADDRALEVGYQVRSRGGKKVQEKLEINGKAVDVNKGRVFLVDLTVKPPRWQQYKLKLPGGVPAATGKKEAEELAKKVLAGLAKDPKVKAFLEAAGR